MARTKRRGKVARKSRVQTHRNNAMKPRVQTRRNNAVKKSVTRKRPRRSRGKMKGGEEPKIDVESITTDACPVSGRFKTTLKIDDLVRFLNNDNDEYKEDINLFLSKIKPLEKMQVAAEIKILEDALKDLNQDLAVDHEENVINNGNVHEWANNNFYINRHTDTNTPRVFGKKFETLERNSREYEIIFPSHHDFEGKPRVLNFKIKEGVLGNKVYKFSCKTL